MDIQQAIKRDAIELTALCIRSKSYWNYDQKNIKEWEASLTITKEYIQNNSVYKLLTNETLVGFYAYYQENKTDVRLDFLFIDPKFIGKNYGRSLMIHFLTRVKKLNFKRIILDADPNAKDFYSKFGFRVTDQLKSSIEGRFLPIMELKLHT